MTKTVAALLTIAFLLAGCGSDDKGGGGKLGDVLAFFPADSAMVAVIESDPKGPQVKRALALVRKFPGANGMVEQLTESLGEQGIGFRDDIRPALGEHAAVGAYTSADLRNRRLLVVLSGKGSQEVQALVKSLRKTGEPEEYRDATIHLVRGPFGAAAVDSSTLLLGADARQIKSALDMRDRDEKLTEEAFETAATGLTKPSLVRLYGDPAHLLDSPRALAARRVPWVDAMKTYAVAFTAEPDGVTARFRVDTTKRELTPRDLPFVSGVVPPALPDGSPLRIGLRNLGTTIAFVEAAAGAISPEQLAEFKEGLSVIRGRTKADLEKDFAAALGDSIIGTNLGSYILRSQLRSPAKMRATLKKLRRVVAPFLNGAGAGGLEVTDGPSGLSLLQRDGKAIGGYGVVGRFFVAGNASARQLLAAARDRVAPAPGAKGALAGFMDRDLVRTLVIDRLGLPELARLFVRALGDAEGWARVEPAALTGEVHVNVE